MGDTTRNRTFPHGNDNDDATAPPSPSPPETVYYEGCPGCAMERKKENNTGTPYKEFFYVGVTTLASGKVPGEQGWVGEIAAPFLLQQQAGAQMGDSGEHCNSGNVVGAREASFVL
ncbi:hypothetical protein TRIUR3_12254 [Triticum urartu]|uniref:Uncharacterized protein n=1 Tax=Triticum urartu TaxID=4572 RepID=M7ZLK2_TRIUA|nr:hypothetical protein TRIUR3_12254 [Triticum urartu]